MNFRQKSQRAPRPLNEESLGELAVRYAGKYATTQAKLSSYLARKVRERGWDGRAAPEFEAIVRRFADLGYVDDGAYAMAQSRSLTARGYGKRRLADQLRVAGVGADDGAEANRHADRESIRSILRLAQRKRIGPYGDGDADRVQREKWTAALIRAGHAFSLAREVANLRPGLEIDEDQLTMFAPDQDF